ncbi:Uncharacterized protein HZ326_29122 [Fusarium oxysporum f. sp. albedinis]|nr:Uncharacterized protein HZ326_29122 [Fusarium oxysporum f. sp. albedinis]
MLVGVLIDHGFKSAFWTYKGNNSPQLKNNFIAKWTGGKRHSSPMASDELSYSVISPFVPDISQTELSVQQQPDVLSL